MAQKQITYFLIVVLNILSILASNPEYHFTTGTLPYFGPTQPAIPSTPKAPSTNQGNQHEGNNKHSTRVNPETLLIRDLFGEYDSVARPVLNMSKSAEVKFGFRLLSIQLNEVDQLLTSFVWLPHRWEDERLTWDPLKYGNISKLIIPNKMLWLPDTFLYQSSDDSGYVISYDRVPLEYTGTMEWWPSATLLSPCIIDVTYFPFDSQKCSLTIGPWGYHSEQVNYTLLDDEVNLDSYTVSGAWSLYNTTVKRHVTFYPELNMSYTLIDITIQLQRKALYYWLNVIIPCLLLNCLGIGLFILPPDSGEKVGFGLGILLTVFVFAILVNENIPKTSDYTPIIGIYLVIIMSMISLSLFLAILIVNLHHRRPKLTPAPRWVKRIFLEKVPKMFGIKLPKLPLFTGFTMQGITPKRKKKIRMMKRLRQARLDEEKNKSQGNGTVEHIELVRNNHEDLERADNSHSSNENIVRNIQSEVDNATSQSTPTAEQVEMERLNEAYKNMPFDEMHNDEWILIALVMDTLLCWGFLVLLVLSSSMVLIVVPSAQTH